MSRMMKAEAVLGAQAAVEACVILHAADISGGLVNRDYLNSGL